MPPLGGPETFASKTNRESQTKHGNFRHNNETNLQSERYLVFFLRRFSILPPFGNLFLGIFLRRLVRYVPPFGNTFLPPLVDYLIIRPLSLSRRSGNWDFFFDDVVINTKPRGRPTYHLSAQRHPRSMGVSVCRILARSHTRWAGIAHARDHLVGHSHRCR